MNKVWFAVTEGDYGCSYQVHGVFASEELAREYVKKHIHPHWERLQKYYDDKFNNGKTNFKHDVIKENVEEWEVLDKV